MKQVDSWDFQADLKGKKYVLDFWAEWCGPCKAMMPRLERMEEETGFDVYKVNVDEQDLLAQKYGVRSIPMICFMQGEQVIDFINGSVPRERLMAGAAKLKAFTGEEPDNSWPSAKS